VDQKVEQYFLNKIKEKILSSVDRNSKISVADFYSIVTNMRGTTEEFVEIFKRDMLKAGFPQTLVERISRILAWSLRLRITDAKEVEKILSEEGFIKRDGSRRFLIVRRDT